MKYILYDLKTLKVRHIYDKPLTASVCDNFYEINGVAEYNGEIPKNDWLTVDNIHEEIETWTEKEQVQKEVKKIVPKTINMAEPIYNENNEIVDYKIFEQTIEEEITELVEEEIEVEKSKTHIVCDLVAHFYPKRELTEEQKAQQKEKQYNALVTQLIRKKYSADAVEALYANYLDDDVKYQSEFDEFTTYRKECKAKARQEIYNL